VKLAAGGGTGPVIDPADRHLLDLFDLWADELLERLDPQRRQQIVSYLRWGQQRRLAQAAALGTLTTWSTLGARQRTTQAVAFLDWLHTHRRSLGDLDQVLLDTWFAEGTSTRRHSRHFIMWAQRQRLIDRHLRVPNTRPPVPTAMPVDARRRVIARLADDTGLRLEDRVAGLLVALYAQPASRIIRLRRRHITHDAGRLHLALGPCPIEPVAPLDALLAELADQRPQPEDWLFPGATPGQPLTAKTLGQRLLRLDINLSTRIAALHHLIGHIASPVLADLIGYNPNFIAEQAAALGAPWARYAAIRART
jgi:hypothetical protein